MIIAVMGLTGTGKSTFIKLLTGLDVKIGHNLAACKRQPILFRPQALALNTRQARQMPASTAFRRQEASQWP